jgi:hypothetical protein
MYVCMYVYVYMYVCMYIYNHYYLKLYKPGTSIGSILSYQPGAGIRVQGWEGLVCTKCSSTCSGSAIPFELWNILVYFDSFCFWHLDLKL